MVVSWAVYLIKEKYENDCKLKIIQIQNDTTEVCYFRHYHSMEIFATYDILDPHGNKVADGHKASFCLEDVECMPGANKRYECVGYSDQGNCLSVCLMSY